jgi:hypothetical protein
LNSQHVDPNELLIRLGGLWLLRRNDEVQRVIRNDKHLIALTGNAVVRFGKMYGIKYVPPKVYRQVGEQVKRGIGPLLVNIGRNAEKMEQIERRNLSDMGKELNFKE